MKVILEKINAILYFCEFGNKLLFSKTGNTESHTKRGREKKETDFTDRRVHTRHKTHLGCGEPLMGFWPYFLQEYSSGGISAIFGLIAGTLVTLFTLDFLFKQTKSKSKSYQFQKSNSKFFFK